MKECVLVTGSSKGLGEELALVFASNGHDIVLHGRNVVDLRGVEAELTSMGVRCTVVAGDLRSGECIESLARVAKESGVSVLINNAGVDLDEQYAETDLKLPFDEIEDRQIDEIVTTNLVALMKLTRRVYAHFLDKGRGTVININSISGLECHNLRTVYCASKWGLRGFTDTLRLEAEKKGIRVLGVYPSRIRTKPYFSYGMTPREVALKVYDTYIDPSLTESVIDGRPGR